MKLKNVKSKTRTFKISLKILILNALLLFVFATVLYAEDEIKAKVDEYINACVKMKFFSGSILIARGDSILVNKGYGMANYEHDIPNTPQTKFRIASLTKQFTAAAIMQLQEKGLLNVKDPITKYISDYPEGDKITIYHLLTHTSGIPDFKSFPDFRETMMFPSPVEKTIERFKNKTLDFKPGEKFNYSNSGYILLGYIIEKVSVKSYEKFIKENIFQPLNMVNSGYDHNEMIIKQRASGYIRDNDKLIKATYIDMSITYAAGALYSTVEDLYLWDQALYNEKILRKSSLEDMFTPFKENYGYGWKIIKSFFNRNIIYHSGEINGFTASIARFIDEKISIIILNNIEHVFLFQLNKDLEAIVFGEKYEIPKVYIAIKLDPKIYDAYIGQYKLYDNRFITITKDDNRLFAEIMDCEKVEIFPESEKTFFQKVIDVQITFSKNDKGKVLDLLLSIGGHKLPPAKKIK